MRSTRPTTPGKTFDAYKAFLSAHPDVQFVANVDIGAEYADRAIEQMNRAGKVFTIGWNVSKGQLDAIEAGVQVALLDQRWPDQAAFGRPCLRAVPFQWRHTAECANIAAGAEG